MITVSGNLYEISGSASTASFVRFWLRGTGGNQPFVSGTALLAPDGGNTWFADFVPNGSGAVTGSLYSTSQVTVGGVTGAIYYGMQVFQNGFAGPEVPVSASGNININSPNILSVLPVVAAPTGDSTYGRLDGTNGPFTLITVKNFENVLYADQYGSIDAAVTALGSNPGMVVIPSNYAGAESANLITTSSGYKVYFGANNVTIVDLRSNQATPGTPTNAPLYPVLYGGRLAGQLVRFGVNAGWTGTLPDSTAGGAFYNWLNNITLPTNNGELVGLFASAEITGSVSGTATYTNGIVAGMDVEAHANATSSDGTLPTLAAITAGSAITRTSATQNVDTMYGIYVNASTNSSTSGATISKVYGIFAEPSTAGTTSNFSFGSRGNWQTANNTSWHVKDSGGTDRTVTSWNSSDQIINKPLNDANGWLFETLAGATLLSINTTDIRSSLAVKPNTAAGAALGSTALPWSGLVVGNAANQSSNITGTFTANRTVTVPDYSSTLTGLVAATSQKAETAADTNVLTFTPPAVAGTYRISFAMSVSAANTATLGWTASWKDSNGNARTPTNLSLFQEGAAAPALTFTTSAIGTYYATTLVDIDNSATNIVVKLTFSGTSFAAKVSATIERIQ